MGILNCMADFMAAMLVDKNKRVPLRWELNRFFLANSGMKIFTGIYTVLSTNMAALWLQNKSRRVRSVRLIIDCS